MELKQRNDMKTVVEQAIETPEFRNLLRQAMDGPIKVTPELTVIAYRLFSIDDKTEKPELTTIAYRVYSP